MLFQNRTKNNEKPKEKKKKHIQESQKVRMLVAQLCSTLCDPMDCSPQGSSVHGISQVRILEWVAIPFSGDLPNPGVKPSSPTLQVDTLPAEPQGNPKNTGVGFVLES